MKQRTSIILASVAVLLSALASTLYAADTPALQLKSCAIELVDGTTVQGHLAVQFDMDDHLIVYSPRLATVRSFLKEHVHAVTVGGKREQLNPKRELTEEDRKLLEGVEWPEVPPASGPAPAYCAETWEKPKRLLVWAHPGVENLRAENPSNWLLNGRPVEKFEYIQREPFVIDEASGEKKEVRAVFDTDTDILIPGSEHKYRIVYKSEKANLAPQCRHLTTGVNAMYRPRNLSRMEGNLWNRGGDGCMSGRKWIRFSGDKDTFIINNVYHPGLAPEPVGSGMSYLQTIFAHEVYFDKGEGSVHLLGPMAAKYHMKALTGTVIVGRDAMLMYASDSPFTVAPEATIELRSGGIVAYRGASYWGKSNEKNDYRMVLRGTLRGGSAEAPLESDCYVGVPTFEHREEGLLPRLIFAEGSTVEVHTPSADTARMVVTNDGRDDGEYISILVRETRGLDLAEMTFDCLAKGGILLADMDMREQWKAASFGGNNEVGRDELFAPIPRNMELGEWIYSEDSPVPDIQPVPRVHVNGRDTVRVTLDADAPAGTHIRYTLDGSVPHAESERYDEPIPLKETAVVRARCFENDHRLGPPARALYVFDTPASLDPAEAEDVREGLAVAHHGKANPFTSYDVFEKDPERTGVVEEVGLDFTDSGRVAIEFTGYLRIGNPGVYRFEAVTDRRSHLREFARLSLAGQEIFQNPSYHLSEDDVRLSGVARLKAGLYRLQLRALVVGDRLELRCKGPEFDWKPVPAEWLKH
jgi:hypothetical protein